MFAFVKKFRETNVKIRIGEQICKKLLANVGNVEELVETNYSQVRIWWEDALIAQRSYQNPEG